MTIQELKWANIRTANSHDTKVQQFYKFVITEHKCELLIGTMDEMLQCVCMRFFFVFF